MLDEQGIARGQGEPRRFAYRQGQLTGQKAMGSDGSRPRAAGRRSRYARARAISSSRVV